MENKATHQAVGYGDPLRMRVSVVNKVGGAGSEDDLPENRYNRYTLASPRSLQVRTYGASSTYSIVWRSLTPPACARLGVRLRSQMVMLHVRPYAGYRK